MPPYRADVGVARTRRLRAVVASLKPPDNPAALRAYQGATDEDRQARENEIARWVMTGEPPVPAGVKWEDNA